MHFLRCVLAEWQLVRARLVRSRLGLWLLLLALAGAVLVARSPAPDPVAIAIRVAMLGAVLGVSFAAGSDADRAALTLTLTHPTSPAAVAVGRWLAAVTAAALAPLAVVATTIALGEAPAGVVRHAALTGLAGAAGTAAVTLPGVWLGGNAVAVALFLYIALARG